MQPTGTSDVIASATSQSLRDYHDRCLKAGSSVLAIYGDFDAATARAAVEKLFADLPKGEITLKSYPARVIDPKGES